MPWENSLHFDPARQQTRCIPLHYRCVEQVVYCIGEVIGNSGNFINASMIATTASAVCFLLKASGRPQTGRLAR